MKDSGDYQEAVANGGFLTEFFPNSGGRIMVTYRQLLAKAKEVGCTIEVDDDCQCYRALAPDGKCWEPELHEYIAVFGGGIIGNGATKAEARADLLESITGEPHMEPGFMDCENPECDWCHPIEE